MKTEEHINYAVLSALSDLGAEREPVFSGPLYVQVSSIESGITWDKMVDSLKYLTENEQVLFTDDGYQLVYHGDINDDVDIDDDVDEVDIADDVDDVNEVDIAVEPPSEPEPEPEPSTEPTRIEVVETGPELDIDADADAEPPTGGIETWADASSEMFIKSLQHEVTEVRLLRKRPHIVINGRREWVGLRVGGYFDDAATLCAVIEPYLNDEYTEGIYVSLQECLPSLLSRSANELKTMMEGEGTADHDVKTWRVFPIDVDPVRPKGISSTDAELSNAREKAMDIQNWFTEHGITTYRAISSNGYHVLVYLQGEAVTDETRDLVEDLVKRVAARWSDEKTKGDASIFNPARIWKLYGTTSRKGSHTADRPHRKSRIKLPPNLDDIERYSLADVAQVLQDNLPSAAPEEETRAVSPKAQREPYKPVANKATDGKRLPALNSKEDLETLALDCGCSPSRSGRWKKVGDWDRKRMNCGVCGGVDYAFISYHAATGKCGYTCSGDTCKKNGTNLQALYEKQNYRKVQFDGTGGHRKPKRGVWIADRAVYFDIKRAVGELTKTEPAPRKVVENENLTAYACEGLPCDVHEDCEGTFLYYDSPTLKGPVHQDNREFWTCANDDFETKVPFGKRKEQKHG